MTNPLDASRRRALTQLSALSAATLSPWALRGVAAQTPLTIGVIYVGPRDDFGSPSRKAERRSRGAMRGTSMGPGGLEPPTDGL